MIMTGSTTPRPGYAERAPSFGRDNLVRLFEQSPPQPHLCHALQVSARRPTEALRDGGEVARALEIFMEGVVPEAQDLRGRQLLRRQGLAVVAMLRIAAPRRR